MGLPNSELPLTEQFLQYGRYVRDWSPRTVDSYRISLRECPTIITKASLNAAVVAMRGRGLSPGGVNVRARAINSFLTWLHEDGHLTERLKIKLLKNPPKPITTLTESDIKLLASFRPKGRIQTRTWVLAMLLVDCGLRIGEALGLDRNNVDLDNLALRVLGKGNKERLVPISLELRKHLFRFLKHTTGRYVFAAFSGAPVERHNAYAELQAVCRQAGITTHVHPHGFRHAYAVHATRNGLDVFRLSRILGHSSINTTQIYLRSIGFDHLRDSSKCSPLRRVSGTSRAADDAEDHSDGVAHRFR
jgi:integrase/recombinase XerD